MAKFKVGDRVKTIIKPYCTRLKKNQELTITRITNYVGPTRGPMYAFDDTCNGVYEAEIELAVPLFRKGDKVLVKYTVEQDQVAGQQNIRVSVPGLDGQYITCGRTMLEAGTITRAPEPPYVPKVGDKFIFSGIRCLCLFADEKSIMYENRANGHRYVCSPSLYTFKSERFV